MALRQLLKRTHLSAAQSEAEKHKEARAALDERKEKLTTREAEATAALEEMTQEATQEARDAVEAEVAAIEAEREAIEAEEAAFEEEQARLDQIVADLEKEIADMDERAKQTVPEQKSEKREEKRTMETRKFFGMTHEQRDQFFAREDVKDFLQRVRTLGGEKRAITGAELLIPEVMLGIIRERAEEASKLYKHVDVRNVSGKARVRIAGSVPEAVWTEMCGTLNELEIGFNIAEVDGYKVGGFVPVCNAILEDSDISLATEIITMLGSAIGLALDKAILYGTGTKMPLGILPRLAQTSDPGTAPEGARPWVNLSTSNIKPIAASGGLDLFKELITVSGAAKGKYSAGGKFWAMNEATHTRLIAESLSINAVGAITAGVNGTMPVIGGTIEELEFIPDGVIFGGYGDKYLLAERAGTQIAQSEHYRFVEDLTVFKGTARYDGQPVIPEAFVVIGLDGSTPSPTAVTFKPDEANAEATYAAMPTTRRAQTEK